MDTTQFLRICQQASRKYLCMGNDETFSPHKEYPDERYSHDGRLTVKQNWQMTGRDELLHALYREHKQPRYDLYPDMFSLSKSGCTAIS